MSTSNIILTRAVTQASHSANTTPSSTWAERSRHHACPALSDDNGNDLQLSVAEIRRKFDPKMTVTRLPAHEPALYKTAHSSDNIYSQVKNLKSISSILNGDDKPVSGHKPHSIDKYMNGTTGSLRWEFLSPSPSPVDSKSADTNGYTIKHATEPGSDISTIYIAGKMNAERSPKNSVKNQLNANNAMGKILEKSTTVYVGNGDVNNPTMCNGKQEKNYDPPKNVLNIEIGNSNSIVANGVDDANLCSKKVQNHTSDFASYIQVSSSIPSSGSKYDNTDSNAIKENGLPLTNGYESQENGVKNITSSLNTEENDRHKLRFIDSEPNSESDSRLFIDKDDNYSPSVDENGFENKTFEHENLLLRNKAEDKLIDYSTKPKRLLADVEDDLQDSSEDVVDSGSSVEDPKIPETPILRRKIIDNNAETSSSYQPYQNESSGKRSTSPVAAASSSSTLSSASSRQNNSGEVLSKTSGLNGLRNIGNTCFMNSVVQCLSNTRPLMEYCGSPEAINKDINTTLSCMKGALIKAFSTVIFELWKADETDGVVNTTALKSQIQRFAPRFMGYSQQDAQEFLRYLLEGLHEDVNRVTVKPKPILTEIDDNLSDAQKAMEAWQRYLRMEDSRVGDIFVGQLKSSLRCTHCSHTSVTFDPFWDLSLSIPSRTGQMKLTQCLSHFTREEEMDGDEKPTCSKCQVRRKCLKWFTVQKFPRVLVIHLKRFSPTERFRGKLNVTVEFPLTHLDMTPYSANNVKAVYSLYAVSNHSGTTYSGHYTAYCKHPYNGEWHEYNDSRVSPIAAKSVVSSEAYVLFYELTSGPTS